MSRNPASILYDASGNAVAILDDSGVYRVRTESKLATGHGLALESKQDTLLTELQAKADLTETQPVNAAQGTKAAAADAWPVVLYDAAGNAIDVPLVNGVRRLAVDVQQDDGQSITVTVGQDVPANLNNYVSTLVTAGGSSNLIVNGSVTPVYFDYLADPTQDIALTEIRIIAACQDIAFDGATFGGKPSLPNGLLVQLINVYGTQTVFKIQTNEDFLIFPSPVGTLLNNTGPKDVFAAGFYIGGSILRAGTSDKIRITVRDDLTGGGAAEFKYLKARVFGVKAT